MLLAFWFRTNKWLGYGVTAYDQHDAERLLRALDYPAPGVEVTEIVPDIRHSDLDQNHVAPNAGPIVVRGVWYPRHNL